MKRCAWLIWLLAACSTRSEKPHLPLNEMKVIVWDMIQAGEWYNVMVTKDTLVRKQKKDVALYSKVLAVHGITRETFYDSYRYYEAHPAEFKVLVDSIDAYSLREKNREYERQAKKH